MHPDPTGLHSSRPLNRAGSLFIKCHHAFSAGSKRHSVFCGCGDPRDGESATSDRVRIADIRGADQGYALYLLN